MLAEDGNFAALARINRELSGRVEAIDSPERVVLDMDSTEIPVHGQQEQSAYNGHFESTCYHPLLLFHRAGDSLATKVEFRGALGPGELFPRVGFIVTNLGNLWRRVVLRLRVGKWSLTSLQQRLVKTGGRLIQHARYYWLLLAEGHLRRRLFGAMLRRGPESSELFRQEGLAENF